MKQSFVFSGSGGQGIMSAGITLAGTAIAMGKHSTFLPEYGPEQRGGSAKCTVIISDGDIISPLPKMCDTFIAMNDQAYAKFIGNVKPGGTVIINSSRVTGALRDDVKNVCVPVDDVALQLGNVRVANTVLTGVLIGATAIVSKEAALKSIEEKFRAKSEQLLALNVAALEKGIALGQGAEL